MFLVYPVNKRLGRNAFFLRLEHDRCAVGIVGADEIASVAAQPLESHPDIGLDIFEEMAKVNLPVGVGQGACNQDFSC